MAPVAVLAACSGTPPPSSASYRGPQAVASYIGVTETRPGTLWPYLAVADARGADLRILDPASDNVLNSPGHAFPLSIPVLQNPRYLASASLRDGQADLLAVAGVGTQVQIVATWVEGTGVARSYDLSGLAGPGAEILSMTAIPYPGPPAGTPPVATVAPGRALLLVGFSGTGDQADGFGGKGRLVAVELDRAADGKSIEAVASAVNALGFDPVSLSVSPDGFHLYAATPDPIADFTTWPPAPTARQVQGAAEVDMSAAPGSWPVRGLDARAPTMLVAVAVLGERVYRSFYVKDQPPNDKFGVPVPRVYAVLDPAGCGADHPIPCGIATLDPATGGILPDPAPSGPIVPSQSYRTPIEIPALALTLAIGVPAITGETQCVEGCPQNTPDGVLPDPVKQPLLRLAPSSGQRWTPAAALAGAADGNSYLLDLARYQVVNDVALLTLDETRLNVTSALSFWPTAATAHLGLYRQYISPPDLTSTSTQMVDGVIVTPGFTPNEVWDLGFQSVLPALGQLDTGGGTDQDFALGLDPSGRLVLALQTAVGTAWVPGPDVTDPKLGVHAADAWPEGDIVLFRILGDPCSPDPTNPVQNERRIASILPKDPIAHPGGAFLLAATPDDACLAAYLGNPANPTPVGKAQVRASGMVLIGSLAGYAGRPQLLDASDLTTPDATLAKRYNFAWADESTLTGEALELARKARRHFYPFDRPCRAVPCYGPYPELTDPLMPGPVVGFIVGALCSMPDSTFSACPPSRLNELQRGSYIEFVTNSGFSPMFRRPAPISLPTGAIAVDKSQFSGSEVLGMSFYVTYQLDSLLVAPPGQSSTSSKTLR